METLCDFEGTFTSLVVLVSCEIENVDFVVVVQR